MPSGVCPDFIGHGAPPRDPSWSNGAHFAVNFVMKHEEGAAGLKRLLDHFQKHDGVPVTRRIDIRARV